MRPSQSICSGTAMSCLAVKALSVLSVLLIHTRPEAVSPIERLLFCLIQFLLSVRAPGFSLQVSPSVTCSGL